MFGQGQGMNNGPGSMSARAPQGAAGAVGRNIHINPNFQQKNISSAPGANRAGFDGQSKQYPNQQQQQHFQGQGQGPAWNQGQGNNTSPTAGRSGQGRPNVQGSDRDGYASDRDRNQNGGYSSDRRGSDRAGRRSSVNLDRPLGSRRSCSPAVDANGSSGSPSITSRLGLGTKRPGDGPEEPHKVPKSSGSSTPRQEHTRLAESSTLEGGSVSFLREKRLASDRDDSAKINSRTHTNVEPKGHVKMENVPDSVSDDSLRKLANGITGVDRVLVSGALDGQLVFNYLTVKRIKC